MASSRGPWEDGLTLSSRSRGCAHRRFHIPLVGTDRRDFSIEIAIGDREQVGSFAFHVRGGDLAAFVVADILRHLGLRAFDPSTPSGIFELDGDLADGLRAWRHFRDTTVGKTS